MSEKTAVSKCQSGRGFQEYPPQLKGALCILGEWAMKEVKDTFKRKRLRVKRGRRHARHPPKHRHSAAAEGASEENGWRSRPPRFMQPVLLWSERIHCSDF